MYIRMLAIFSLGATVGYTAHRPSSAAASATAAPPVVAKLEAPPPPAPTPATGLVAVHAPPTLPVPAAAEAPVDAAEPDAEPDAAAEDPGAAPAPRGVLQGTVTDARSGHGVYRVRVIATSLVSDTIVTYTDDDGGYRIDGLQSAAYTVSFQRYGELPAERGAGVNQLDPTTLDVAMQPDPRFD
jgi:hypothetical protein